MHCNTLQHTAAQCNHRNGLEETIHPTMRLRSKGYLQRRSQECKVQGVPDWPEKKLVSHYLHTAQKRIKKDNGFIVFTQSTRIAVWIVSPNELRRAAVCCSVLQCVAVHRPHL